MIFPRPGAKSPPILLVKMNIKHALGFSFGLFCYLFAISMFFYFPGVEAWTFSALHPFAALRPVSLASIGPRPWINVLMALLVFMPGLFGPLLLITRARRYVAAKLILGCLALAGLYVLAGLGEPLLYGRVALLALLSGHLLALGLKHPESVPYNWMLYLAFVLANFSFPDDGILAGANFLAAGYLLGSGVMLFVQSRKATAKKKPGYRVMVG
ncbi:MAG: hypothetical protein JWP91_3750 [Fibrobacteres bacterium]|nr:hypothetical protein [Fibrobacterota bacterium]